MRKAFILGGIWLAVAGVAAAQYGGGQSPQGQAHASRPSSTSQNQNGHGHDNTPPPPTPRCAELAVTTLGFASSIPGGAPLAAGEVALEYDVHNAGTSMYVAPGGASQALVLEYTTPSGTHQVANTALPPQAAGATPA